MATKWIRLKEFASARSGDKGDHANIGIVARSEPAFQFLRGLLTADYIHDRFRSLGVTRTERFELPKVWALNFVLYDALAGGASQSLRIDTQGKLLGTEIMELELPVEDASLALLIASGCRQTNEDPQRPSLGASG